MTDRRRWESALFLQVRDEIQTGNLAIDGAKKLRPLRGLGPVVRRHVVPLPALLVQPQPAPFPLPEVSPGRRNPTAALTRAKL